MTVRATLGVDLGTSGVKVVLVDDSGTVLARAARGYAVSSPCPGWAESDPADWERATREAVAEVVGSSTATVAALGVDGQMHGSVLVDGAGAPVRAAVLWPDSRAREELALWRDLAPVQRSALANPLTPGMTGPVLAWLCRHEPEVLARAARVLLPKDWLRSRLVPGALVTDASDASATLLYDVVADAWDRDLVARIGVDPAMLPTVVGSGDAVGTLDATTAEAWGLPAGIPVAAGCADVAATLLGSAAPEGRLLLTVGTGGQVVLPGVTPRPADPATFHTYRAAEGHYAMAAVMNAGLALERVVTLLGAGWEEVYADYDRDRALPVFVPFLAGERLPTPTPPGGGWSGITLATARADLLAAALEGVAFGIRRAIEWLPQGEETVDLAGGGSRSPVLSQLLADTLGRPLRRVHHPDASAVGAARLGLRSAGEDLGVPTGGGELIEPAPSSALEERYLRFVEMAGG